MKHPERSHQQAGAHQKKQRKSQLTHDQGVANPVAEASRRSRPAGFFERLTNIHRCGRPGWNETKDKTGEYGDCHREKQYPVVQTLGKPRQIIRF